MKEKNIMEIFLSSDYKLITEVFILKKKFSYLSDGFRNAPNYRLKITLLSLIPKNFSYQAIIVVFKTTRWQIQKAREHFNELGPGAFTDPIFHHRDRIDKIKVKIFLEFICQDQLLQDVAYGHTMLKINKDIYIAVTHSVRTEIHKNIVNFYFEMCKEEKLKPLGQTTC